MEVASVVDEPIPENLERRRRIEELERKLAHAEKAERLERREKRSHRLKAILGVLAVVGVAGVLVVAAQSGLLSGARIGGGSRAPDFTVVDSDGKAFHLRETDGTARVLFFMTSSDWCQPCKLLTRGPLREIHAKYGPNVTIVSLEMISNERSDADLNAYKTRYGATWAHARDTEGVAQRYGVASLSIVVVLDQEGRVKFKGADPPADTMSRVIEAMGIHAQTGGTT